MFRSLFYHKYNASAKKAGNPDEELHRPSPEITVGMNLANYEKLDNDGVMIPGHQISGEGLIIDRTLGYTSIG